MKITKQGKPHNEKEWSGVCSFCGGEAIALTQELSNIGSDFRDYRDFAWKDCPCCHKKKGMLFYPIRERLNNGY